MLKTAAFLTSFEFDAQAKADIRQQWLRLIELSVWGELHINKIGALPRLRKRLLEVGENLVSVFASREWIPQPREHLKSALGASVKLRDSLLDLERTAVGLEPSRDFAEFEPILLAFRVGILTLIERHEAMWAELMESLYTENDESGEPA